MTIRVFRCVMLVILAYSAPSLALYEDQVGVADWYRQYIGKVKDAVFHTQKTGRKRVFVSTEENVIASLDLRRGEIIWRHVLGEADSINKIDIALGKYLISLSSGGSILRAWNIPDGQMVWESHIIQPQPSKPILFLPKISKDEKDQAILVSSGSFLISLSSTNGEVLWKKVFPSKGFQSKRVIQPPGSGIVTVVGIVDSSRFDLHQVKIYDGESIKHQSEFIPSGLSGEISLVSSNVLAVLGSSENSLVIINIEDSNIRYYETHLSELIRDFSGKAVLQPTDFNDILALEVNTRVFFIRVSEQSALNVVDEYPLNFAYSEALQFSENERVFALVRSENDGIQLQIKKIPQWETHMLDENTVVDGERGQVHKVFLNSYIRTDRSHGFRVLIVMEDHSLLLLQQGEIVWSREDGLASIIDVIASELPVENDGVSVAKVEHNLFEWLKGHFLKLKGTLMLATPEDVLVIQDMRLKSSEKNKMTRDHNGFRKLFIVLTKSGKVFALHSGDGRIVWSVSPFSNLKTEACESPIGTNLYQWQVPHHHALDKNPSVLVIGTCNRNSNSPTLFSFVDAYTGNNLGSSESDHSFVHVIPLPFTDATEQRLHLLVDRNQHARLYPKTSEALRIFLKEFDNIYWYSVDDHKGIISGHALTGKRAVDFCFGTRSVWSVVFPPHSEKIIATSTRKTNEVVHTQAKILNGKDVIYKYISKNLLFVATTSPSGDKSIGTLTPEQATLTVYLLDSITGRILHRMVHHGAQGPVHSVLSENWVIYHYFNVRAHRFEMSVVEVFDETRAENRDVLKLVVGKHNLSSPVSSYSSPEILCKSQSYFFTHSVRTISVTSTAKGITSKQILIGTANDQILALDKRFLDPRRSANPTQMELEEGIVALADALPINPQSYITHSVQVGGLKGILTVPARLESTTLVFAYGVDHFFIRLAPSRTYDSLTEDFSYALLLITIFALVAAIFVTWIFSQNKDLRDKWR